MKQLIELNLSQEELFILLICRIVSTNKSIEPIEDFLNKSLNWNFILNMADRHGISCLLYVTLSQYVNTGNIPDYLLKKLEAIYRHNALRNLLYSKEFIEIVTNFNDANIRTIPLKGIEFLHSLYAHNIALRNLNDIDILVEKVNVPRAEKILVGMGYEKQKTSNRISQRQFHANFLCRRRKQPVMLELHWDVDFPDSPYHIDINEFWERCQDISDRNFKCHGFSIEDNIIFNSLHILREARSGLDEFLALKNFCDIATIITQSSDKINWDCIIQRSRKYNVMRPVLLVLMLVQKLLGISEIPQSTADAVRKVGYQDAFSCCAVKEFVFPNQNNENKMVPLWLIEFADRQTLREKIKVFINLPKAISNLYTAKYYDASNHSATKAVLSIAYYYTKKIIRTAAFYLFTPRKAIRLQKKLVITNRRTEEVINWLRG